MFKAMEFWHCMDFETKDYSCVSVDDVSVDLQEPGLLFLLQVSDFIREFDKLCPTKDLPIIVDVECFVKQFWQKSKPLESQTKWNLFRFMKENEYLPKDFRIQDSLQDYLKFLVDFIDDLWSKKSIEELERFEKIEVLINKLIYARQRKGINIDFDSYPKLIQSIEEDLYSIKNQLQLKHFIYTPDNEETQIEILKKEVVEINGSLLTLFKSKRGVSEVCDLIYQMIRVENDLSALIYLTSKKGGKSRTYPSFYGFGSISSRITLREPALQNLRKDTRRNIIKPDLMCEFIYVDFSQFEAGILASLSHDLKLRKLYDADIYEDINKSVWGGSRGRDEAKILFYKYMYGMKFKSSNESRYFESFTSLNSFRETVEGEIEEHSKVGSSFGNFRILSEEDKTIALSHRIQSEASLIFKEALLMVNEQVAEAEFLLPMHDAALYQVNISLYDKKKVESKIRAIFKSAFARRCPGINHTVNSKEF